MYVLEHIDLDAGHELAHRVIKFFVIRFLVLTVISWHLDGYPLHLIVKSDHHTVLDKGTVASDGHVELFLEILDIVLIADIDMLEPDEHFRILEGILGLPDCSLDMVPADAISEFPG